MATCLEEQAVYGPYEPKVSAAARRNSCEWSSPGAWVDTEKVKTVLHFQDAVYMEVSCILPTDGMGIGWPVIGKSGEPVNQYHKPKT